MSDPIDYRKKISGVQLILLYMAVTTWSSSVAAVDAPLKALSESTLRDEIRAADTRSLMEQFEHPADEVSQALAAMALDRVTWHLDHSSSTAQTCAKALRDTMPVTAFFCAKFAAGNLRLKGDYAGAARADQAAASTFKTVADADPSFQGFLRDNALYLSMPPITVERSGDVSVPVHFDAQRAYTMDASVNGQVLNIGLDTGAVTTLTQGTAHRLGVRVVVPDHGNAVGFLGKSSPQSLGVIDSLQLGEATLRHVPVEIVDEGRDVIGNDVLMQLGRFRISHDALQLPNSPQALSACQQPMVVSTAAFGGATLLVEDITINGTPRRTLMDTGDSFVLTGSAGALGDVRNGTRRKVHTRDLTHADRDVEAVGSHMNMSLGGTTRSVDVAVFPDVHLPYDYILGAGALADATLEVDFDQAHLCVTAK